MRVSCETAARKRVFEATLGARRLLSPIIYDEMCDVRMPAKPFFPFLFLFEIKERGSIIAPIIIFGKCVS